MKTRNAITNLITKTMAVAALAAGLLCATGWLQPVQAQTGGIISLALSRFLAMVSEENC